MRCGSMLTNHRLETAKDHQSEIKVAYRYLVSCPDRTRTLYAREYLVHQVQILGSVPQNEERPIRSLKDYVITFLSILLPLRP